MDFPFQLNAMDWLLIAAIAIGVASILLNPLRNSEAWKKRGITTWGPLPLVIFFRTDRGLGLLNWLSWPKALWRLVATAGVPLVVLSMAQYDSVKPAIRRTPDSIMEN